MTAYRGATTMMDVVRVDSGATRLNTDGEFSPLDTLICNNALFLYLLLPRYGGKSMKLIHSGLHFLF